MENIGRLLLLIFIIIYLFICVQLRQINKRLSEVNNSLQYVAIDLDVLMNKTISGHSGAIEPESDYNVKTDSPTQEIF